MYKWNTLYVCHISTHTHIYIYINIVYIHIYIYIFVLCASYVSVWVLVCLHM